MAAPQFPRDDDDAIHQRVVSKVARRLMPFLALLYIVNYLDRTNIGFAKLTMNAELGLTESMFGLASGLFFIGYLLLEVPSNLALHKFGARRWIARIMLTWGIIATATAFVPNAATLYVLRVLLGAAEAGFFPGIILYLTYWFPRQDRARFTAWFMVAVPVSTVLGSPLSTLLIQYGDGLFGLSGWRVMYLVEGIPAVLLAFITWRYLTDRPSDATWLTEEERTWLTDTMAREEAETTARYRISLRRVLLNGRVLALVFVYFGIVYGLYALSFFLPTIIQGFQDQFGVRYSIVQIGLITAIPYAVAAVAMLLWARHADVTGERVWHVAIPALCGGVSIPLALYLSSPVTAMAAVTVCAVGVMCALPTFWSLPTAFLSGAAAAGGIALINSFGNLAGFSAPFITGWLQDSTGSSKPGLWIVGVAMILAGVITLILKATPHAHVPADTASTSTTPDDPGQPSHSLS